MSIQKSEAIILKIREFRETSLIVSFFTKDFGKVSGIIKGIRNQPQRYGGMPKTFARNHIIFYEKSNSDLNLVTHCEEKEVFPSIRRDWEKTNYAHYFVELLDIVTPAFDKNEPLFTLIVDSLAALSQDFPGRQIARLFEVRLLNLSGFKPRLDGCVNCQGKIRAEHSPARFSAVLGGMLCPGCFTLDRNAKAVNKGTLASITYIENANWQKSLQLKMNGEVAAELAGILSNFLDIHLDKKINSRKFLI